MPTYYPIPSPLLLHTVLQLQGKIPHFSCRNPHRKCQIVVRLFCSLGVRDYDKLKICVVKHTNPSRCSQREILPKVQAASTGHKVLFFSSSFVGFFLFPFILFSFYFLFLASCFFIFIPFISFLNYVPYFFSFRLFNLSSCAFSRTL
jgi:hypothetical protein